MVTFPIIVCSRLVTKYLKFVSDPVILCEFATSKYTTVSIITDSMKSIVRIFSIRVYSFKVTIYLSL